MKKEKSVISIVFTHILTTSIVIPFFGLLAGYFVNKFLGQSLDKGLLIILKDIVYIIFFFLGVKYSISYIAKNIDVKKPKESSKYSIIVFAILITSMWIINILPRFNLIGIVYNTIFYSVIFIIFFIPTKKYFAGLQKLKTEE
ncbi:hypothetical protein FA592_11640 [Sulfurospirillum diekertiae]|uniref:Uncharacterized protein n=1 Tax=Sulfurospirillum diekertiae TaxID=1854492 RepID=A0A6G9VV81_9BACT|nr:hypothetical protein [Sulfurospirillum diekertiae]ASC93120.1 hypothetical protein Sdiek2_1099 [Sulfurospirillum diekertiae]QIR76849.1 hypothetical protein FA584_11850 [Sulfurospirillum diekertiae]QIR79467.1 hypothetical protein FA592_11640 [Sulfurospirillum diekertiae]